MIDGSDAGVDIRPSDPVSITLYLDDAKEPFATYRPPATVVLDTTSLEDGTHRLHIRATDGLGNVGRRTITFLVANGPGITVTGLREGKAVQGCVEFKVNAFGSAEPFDATRAESHAPIPVWVWLLVLVIGAWATWYGIEEFPTPAAFSNTPTYAANPSSAAQPLAPASGTAKQASSSGKTTAGFDYGTAGTNLFSANCAACHGAQGTGVPGAFPPLAADPVVTAPDPKEHIFVVLHGLKGKVIGGKAYPSQMPAFAQLNDDELAAIIDHERTSWGNGAPTITPSDVRRLR